MLFGDLDDLEDILDDIEPSEDIIENVFSEEEETDIVESCVQLMYDYIEENPTAISEPEFHNTMIENIKEVMTIFFKQILTWKMKWMI